MNPPPPPIDLATLGRQLVRPSIVAAVTVALPITVLLAAFWRESATWPVWHDLPVMLYMTSAIERFGFVPHVDIFDMNLAGTYASYLVIGKVFGYTPAGIRLADAGVFAALMAASLFAFRPVSILGGWIAAGLFGLVYLEFGPSLTLQREYLMAPFIIGAVGCAARATAPGSGRWALAAGLLIGAAMTIKPHVFVVSVPIMAYVLTMRVSDGSLLRRPLLFAAGISVPLAILLGALVYLGALGAFLDIAFGYLPLYGALDGTHNALTPGERPAYLVTQWLRFGEHGDWAVASVLGLVIGLLASRRDRQRRRFVILMGGMALTCSLYPAISGQFWPYHWLLFLYFASACVAILTGLEMRGGLFARWIPTVALVAVATTVVIYPIVERRFVSYGPDKNGAPERMAEYLRNHLAPGDRVQPLDWTSAGVLHGLLLAEARPATSFFYDFHFYHHVSTPYIQALRRRFMGELDAARPRFVVRGHLGPFPGGPDTTRSFPELEAFLENGYQVVLVQPEFSILERRGPGDSATSSN